MQASAHGGEGLGQGALKRWAHILGHDKIDAVADRSQKRQFATRFQVGTVDEDQVKAIAQPRAQPAEGLGRQRRCRGLRSWRPSTHQITRRGGARAGLTSQPGRAMSLCETRYGLMQRAATPGVLCPQLSDFEPKQIGGSIGAT